MIEQFGKFKRIAYPGFNCVCCCIGESIAGGMSLRIQQVSGDRAGDCTHCLHPTLAIVVANAPFLHIS